MSTLVFHSHRHGTATRTAKWLILRLHLIAFIHPHNYIWCNLLSRNTSVQLSDVLNHKSFLFPLPRYISSTSETPTMAGWRNAWEGGAVPACSARNEMQTCGRGPGDTYDASSLNSIKPGALASISWDAFSLWTRKALLHILRWNSTERRLNCCEVQGRSSASSSRRGEHTLCHKGLDLMRYQVYGLVKSVQILIWL